MDVSLSSKNPEAIIFGLERVDFFNFLVLALRARDAFALTSAWKQVRPSFSGVKNLTNLSLAKKHYFLFLFLENQIRGCCKLVNETPGSQLLLQ